VSTLAGLQYWTDQDGRSSDPHGEQVRSRALSLHRHAHDGYHEYYHGGDYSSIVRDAWSCPQGLEPSNGICQGALLVTVLDVQEKLKFF
jgi:hypothetical protein